MYTMPKNMIHVLFVLLPKMNHGFAWQLDMALT